MRIPVSRVTGCLAIAMLLAGGEAVAGHRGDDFFFVEETDRLPPTREPPDTSTTGVNLVDVDGDGDLDVFLAQGTATLEPRQNVLLINDGRGFFSDQSATRLPGTLELSSKADFADIDDDGDLDAIVAVAGPEQLLLNDGRGGFTDASGQLPPPKPDILEEIAANAQFADVNGDGCLDILVSNEIPFPGPSTGAQNWVWINQTVVEPGHGHGHPRHPRIGCTGLFVDETAARLPAALDQTAAMLAGDIDDDDDLDLVILNRGQEMVYVNDDDGDGFFTDETAERFPVTADSTRGGALVDVDGDGTLDLVTSQSRNQPPRLYFNDGEGNFVQGDFGHTEAPDETDTELLVAKLHDPRFPDIYIADAGAFDGGHSFLGAPDHFFRNRRGTFVEETCRHFDFPVQASTAAAFGDLDGDGDLDLVVGGTGIGPVSIERVFIQKHRHGQCDDD